MSQEDTESFHRTVALKVTFLILIDLVAIFGNVLVCLSVYKNRRLRTKTASLILCLAVSDLLFAISVTPLSTASIVKTDPVTQLPIWISADNEGPECFIYGILMYSLTGLSLSTMAFTAVNRYFCIAHSNLYRKYFTYRMIGTCLGLMFFSIVILLISLASPGYGTFAFQYRFAQCMLIFKSQYEHLRTYIEIITLTFWGVVPFFTIIIFYSMIYFYVRRHNRRIGARLAQNARPRNFASETAQSIDGTRRNEETPSSLTDIRHGQESKENTENKELQQNDKTRNDLSTGLITSNETTNKTSRQHWILTSTAGQQRTANCARKMELNPARNTRLINSVRDTKSEVKTTKILLAVFLGFCICWIPTAISHIINVASDYTRSYATDLALFSISLSTAINPLIFGVGNREFSKAYIKLITCKKVM